MASPNQIAMLCGLFRKKGLWGKTLPGQPYPAKVLDWLFEEGLDVDDLEQLSQEEVTRVKEKLEEIEDVY